MLIRDGRTSTISEEFDKDCKVVDIVSPGFNVSVDTKETLRNASQKESISIRGVVDTECFETWFLCCLKIGIVQWDGSK